MTVPTLEHPVPYKPIAIKQNKDFTYALCVIERDEMGEAVVVDTTGWAVKMQIRREPLATSPVLVEASTANGRIVVGINGEPGEEVNIDITIPASVINAIPNFETVGRCGYDLRVTYPDGGSDYLAEGPAYLRPAYTR